VLKHLSDAYRIPRGVLVVLSIAGLVAFCAIFGFATYSGLVTLWPETHRGVALSVSVVLPLVLLFAVGIGCAKHDEWAGNPKTARRLRIAKWLGLVAVVAYLVLQAVRIFG
jgi:hypothetical protein